MASTAPVEAQTQLQEERNEREKQNERLGGYLSGHPLEVPWRYAGGGRAGALVGVPLALGVTHMGLRAALLGPADLNGAFVGLLVGATLLLVSGMGAMKRYVDARTLQFFYDAHPDESYEELRRRATAFVRRIFHERWMTVSGVAYGVLIASSVFVLDLGPPEPVIRGSLALFLFAVNFVAGIGIFGLVLFFLQVWGVRELVRVTVWHRRNRSTEFIDGIRVRAALLASAYAALSFSAVVVSDIPGADLIVAGYFVFSVAVILAAYAIPGLLIRRRLAEEKLSALAAIDLHLDAEFSRAMEQAREAGAELDLSRIEGLIALRRKVDGLGVWPVGWRSVKTGLGVIVMSALPMVLQKVIQSL